MDLKEIEKRFNKVLPASKWKTPTEGALYYDFLSHAKEDVKWLIARVRKLEGAIRQHKEQIDLFYDNKLDGNDIDSVDEELYAHLKEVNHELEGD